jgi:hypothetical protein
MPCYYPVPNLIKVVISNEAQRSAAKREISPEYAISPIAAFHEISPYGRNDVLDFRQQTVTNSSRNVIPRTTSANYSKQSHKGCHPVNKLKQLSDSDLVSTIKKMTTKANRLATKRNTAKVFIIEPMRH